LVSAAGFWLLIKESPLTLLPLLKNGSLIFSLVCHDIMLRFHVPWLH
jgi:hypothetical protein